MEQRPEQGLHAARAQFRHGYLDRPLAAEHGVAGGQERASVFRTVPHVLRGGDHPRQTFDPLAFLSVLKGGRSPALRLCRLR